MPRKLFRNWCSPRTTLVVMRTSDDPAQVLTAIRHAEKSGAKLLLAQLSAGSSLPEDSQCADGSCSPWVPRPASLRSDHGREILSAEVLKRAFLLTDIALQHVPAVVRTFNIDRVMVTQRRGHQQGAQSGLEESLVSMLSVPVCIIGRSVTLSLAPAQPVRRILLPVKRSTELEFTFNFAMELARAQQAVLSVLHVFDGSETTAAPEQRSPVAVRSWLPLSTARPAPLDSSIEVSIRRGDVATEILAFNARQPHDLIVLRTSAARPPALPSRLSTVSRLFSEMPCPVLVLGNSIEKPAPPVTFKAPAIHHHRARFHARPLGMEG